MKRKLINKFIFFIHVIVAQFYFLRYLQKNNIIILNSVYMYVLKLLSFAIWQFIYIYQLLYFCIIFQSKYILFIKILIKI